MFDDIKIHPLYQRVLVTILPIEESIAESGLIIAAQQNYKETNKGEVVAIGPECEHVVVGDKVVITTGSGDEVEYEQKIFKILEESEILATIARD